MTPALFTLVTQLGFVAAVVGFLPACYFGIMAWRAQRVNAVPAYRFYLRRSALLSIAILLILVAPWAMQWLAHRGLAS